MGCGASQQSDNKKSSTDHPTTPKLHQPSFSSMPPSPDIPPIHPPPPLNKAQVISKNFTLDDTSETTKLIEHTASQGSEEAYGDSHKLNSDTNGQLLELESHIYSEPTEEVPTHTALNTADDGLYKQITLPRSLPITRENSVVAPPKLSRTTTLASIYESKEYHIYSYYTFWFTLIRYQSVRTTVSAQALNRKFSTYMKRHNSEFLNTKSNSSLMGESETQLAPIVENTTSVP